MTLLVDSEPVPIAADSEGVIRVGGTRVTLDSVIASFRNGATAEQIAMDYPVLNLSDIYAVITYYLRHQLDVDGYLKCQREQAAHWQAEAQAKFDTAGVRQRLLAREATKDQSDATASGG